MPRGMVGRTRGLQELLITLGIRAELDRVPDSLVVETSDLIPAEVPDRFALHLGQVIRRLLEDRADQERVGYALGIARAVLDALATTADGTPLVQHPTSLRQGSARPPKPATKQSASQCFIARCRSGTQCA